ncbi:helix-turn-helix transcriptional regulator [Fundidesulfovibrio putealis]|uniref:helix-turn-helix transcriptional regulator n=1 Tax=Fundidesulfovibrio putealis TaxID=270496 RepID=UPI002E1F2A05
MDTARQRHSVGTVNIPKRYLTSHEVAAVYGVNEKTLADWRLKGSGPAYSKLNRLVRYNVDDLESFFLKARVSTRDSYQH